MTIAEKITILGRVDAARAGGIKLDEALAGAGISRATYFNWAGKMKAGGEAALVAKKSTGRKPVFRPAADEAAALSACRAAKDGSLRLAIHEFLKPPAERLECLRGHAPAGAETAAALLAILDRAAVTGKRKSYPASVRRAAAVPAEVMALKRGRKAAQNHALVVSRGMFWRDEDGTDRELHPGDLYESDDMSINQPFRYTDPASGEERIGRQMLCSIDVHSAHWLGVSPTGRPKDAYRVEDIADHMLAIVLAWGLPRFWRLERGPWENQFIDGIALDELGSDFRGRRWGGLGDLFHVARAWTSGGKGTIESSFDFLQSILAGASTDIGRKRGENEAATKLHMRANRGDAAALGKFWEMGECADAVNEAMHEFNQFAKERGAFGNRAVVPEELFRSRPPKRELPESERWRFLPVKKLLTVRQNAIVTTANHWPMPFRFQVNGVPGHENIFLSHGHRVLVAFHPGEPENGCHVFNADLGSRNVDGFEFGQPLLIAPSVDRAPQVDLSGGAGAPGLRQKKQVNAAMRSEFRAISRVGGADTAPRASVARDGLGGALVAARGMDLGGGSRLEASGPGLEGRATRAVPADVPPDIREARRNRLAGLEGRILDGSDDDGADLLTTAPPMPEF